MICPHLYGTAGFRSEASTLPPVLVRVALLAGLRSIKLRGAFIGVMITASHNPVADNGVKVCEPLGEMLVPEWEAYAERLANALDGAALRATVEQIAAAEELDLLDSSAVQPRIVVGYDTRPSSEPLAALLCDGLAALSAHAPLVLGLVTTPQLHFVVRSLNQGAPADQASQACLCGYNFTLAAAWRQVTRDWPPAGRLVIDCANGVGALAARRLLAALGDAPFAAVQLIYTGEAAGDVLNENCGADAVKTAQAAPLALRGALEHGTRYASLDGDADRLVYFFGAGPERPFVLLDGDRIAALAACTLLPLVRALHTPVSFAVVQTAYANGASTRFLASRGVTVVLASTGVKHLHHAAQAYDLAVYFEANGHGTVLFSPSLLSTLDERVRLHPDDAAASTLLALSRLVNQAVGDALSDLLLCEYALASSRMSLDDWAGLYADLPNRLGKKKVADRTAYRTSQADTVLLEPAGLQARIDALVQSLDPSTGRCFVRPSGTEDVVRIYAEAASQVLADELVSQVAALLD